MTVSKFARAAGTSPDTVRYYERLGLLPPAARTRSGYRQFDHEDVERMSFIRAAQRLGLALAEIGELLTVRERGLCPCGRARDLLTAKLPEIEAQLAALVAMRDTITHLLDEDQPAEACWSCAPELLQITTRPEDEHDD